MKRVDMTNVQEPTGFDRPEAGAYICKITAVEDLPAKEYLKVTYDIAEGKYAGYYTKTREEHPDWAWAGAYSKSYKTSALSFFKRFCTAISRSNGNFVFDGGAVNADERTLVGKKIGLLFQEEARDRLLRYAEPAHHVRAQHFHERCRCFVPSELCL